MIGSLFRRLWPPRRDPRQIFSFWDGGSTRRVDPVEAWTRMAEAAGEEWPDLLKTLTLKLPAAPAGVDTSAVEKAAADGKREAAKKLSEAVCAAFGVEPFSEAGGLTIPERIALAADFLGFMGGLAASARVPTTPRSPTG